MLRLDFFTEWISMWWNVPFHDLLYRVLGMYCVKYLYLARSELRCHSLIRWIYSSMIIPLHHCLYMKTIWVLYQGKPSKSTVIHFLINFEKPTSWYSTEVTAHLTYSYLLQGNSTATYLKLNLILEIEISSKRFSFIHVWCTGWLIYTKI